MTDRYMHWRKGCNGSVGDITETSVGLGFYRKRPSRNAPWIPVALWEEDGLDWVQVGNEDPTATTDAVHDNWLQCARFAIAENEYRHVLATGRWLTDPPEDVTWAATLDTLEMVQPPPAAGHNSSDLTAYEAMRAQALAQVAKAGDLLAGSLAFQAMRGQLLGDIAEACAHYGKHAIATKADADKCENWRDRIAKAAKTADAQRAADKEPFKRIGDEIDARYFPVIREAEAQAKVMRALGDAWVTAEQDRLRKIAEEEARVRFAAEKAAAEAERKRLEDERERKLKDDPIAALTEQPADLPAIPEAPEPVVATPKVLIGTGPIRRGARAEPAKATIVDLKQAAAYYAEQQHPDLVALVQKLADKAAKSRAAVPGVRMSWELTSKVA